MGDDLHFYYGAFNMTHNYTMRTDDKRVKMRIGLGTVKRGRLVGYHAGDDEGELLTRSVLARQAAVADQCRCRKG